MKVLVVDDEPMARRRLRTLLQELDVEVAGEAGDGIEALRLVKELRPDVLLLDIAMPEVDGLDVLRHLPEPRPLVVFQTAHDDRAVEAFELEALDYVLKPVTRERLERVLSRAGKLLAAAAPVPTSTGAMERLRAALPRQRRQRLLVRHGAGHRLLPLRELSRVVALQGEVRAFAADRGYLTDHTLAEIEEMLGAGFLRVSRSELVNAEHVETFRSSGDGVLTLVLRGGAEVAVSRRRSPGVRSALESL